MYMTENEIRRRYRDGASLTVLAELNACGRNDIARVRREG